MADFTQEQIDALKAVIATGKKSYTHIYQDRRVSEEFQDTEQMLRVLQLLEQSVAAGGGRSTFATFRRGTES